MKLAGEPLLSGANMSETFYVLMEEGWDYNDEVFFRTENGGGHPEKVFADKEKAEAEANRLNMKRFRELVTSGEVHEYAYSLDDILSDKATEDDLMFEEGIFMQMFGKTAEDWWENYYNQRWEDRRKGNLKVEPTDEQWGKLYDCFNLGFYEVVTVEKG